MLLMPLAMHGSNDVLCRTNFLQKPDYTAPGASSTKDAAIRRGIRLSRLKTVVLSPTRKNKVKLVDRP